MKHKPLIVTIEESDVAFDKRGIISATPAPERLEEMPKTFEGLVNYLRGGGPLPNDEKQNLRFYSPKELPDHGYHCTG